jgi:hypothetical protein
MKFLEKDLEEIIYETYKKEPHELYIRGLEVEGKIKRQLRIGNYGIADLVTFKRGVDCDYAPHVVPILIVTVYELKKDKIGISAYLQAIGYSKGLRTFFEERNVGYEIDLRIVLIGRIIDSSGSFCFIPSFDNNVNFYTYRYDVKGILFEECNNFNLRNTGL